MNQATDPTPEIDVHLVRALVDQQFPFWASLPVRPVPLGGNDNRTFRLGGQLLVRLPSDGTYAAAVEKEQRWLPVLAAGLPLPIPAPVAAGAPGLGYRHPWSVYQWIEGRTAAEGPIEDLGQFAAALARFLVALQDVDPTGGPPPGAHNFFRGGDLGVYAGETVAAIGALGQDIDGPGARAVWDKAITSRWTADPVWVHGDVAAGNLLVRDGRLSAVIDFGGTAVGDPACDLVIAWTLLSGTSRQVFRAARAVAADTWARGRGWALWKALITLVGLRAADPGAAVDPAAAARPRRVIAEVLADHRREHRSG